MKKLNLLWMALLGLSLVMFMGCPPADDDDDDNDSQADDDDMSDDDDDDVTDDDDDVTDDDDDDDTWPDSPTGFPTAADITATGGAAGGAATVSYTHTMIDSNYNPLCDITFDIEADYTYGPGQGDDYYQFIDEVITWTAGTETANNCPAEWAIYEGDMVEWFQWYMHPQAFVSCELIDSIGNLAEEFLGMDDSGYIPTTDGTYGDFCATVGPSYQGAAGTGPMEAVQLMPGTDGSLESLGEFGYFPGADTTNVEVWLLLGLLMADAANTDEPVEGLEGDYTIIPFWLWTYQG